MAHAKSWKRRKTAPERKKRRGEAASNAHAHLTSARAIRIHRSLSRQDRSSNVCMPQDLCERAAMQLQCCTRCPQTVRQWSNAPGGRVHEGSTNFHSTASPYPAWMATSTASANGPRRDHDENACTLHER